MTYADKLKDPRWQKKRLEILNRDEFTCRFCGSKKNTLHVHHTGYATSNPWETPDKCLVTLCEFCHEQEERDLQKSIDFLIKHLKLSGFTSKSFDQLSGLFQTDRDWATNPFSFSVIARIIDNDDIWNEELETTSQNLKTYLSHTNQNG